MKKNDLTLPLPELLAPAGNEESLAAALAAGADAVYFGGRGFSNRMRARNFTDDSLKKAIALVHDAGALAYITVNTRVRDREIDDVLALCEVILGGDEKCDAVICADLGLAALIRERYPHAILHGSTQTSCSSATDCEALSKLGFTRLVVPRELSCKEISVLCRSTDAEIEMFIHGAHCVSLSGQCLMSYFIGNRSGNRGECAQPCRLPYQLGDSGRTSYPLSLRDMCLGGMIPEIISSGVKSLKIEGRLKTPTYVYGVTKIYRELLDERRAASKEEIKALADLFTRGFTDGYFTHRYSSMTGEKSSENAAKVPQEFISKELKARVSRETISRKEQAENAKLSISGKFLLTAEKSELTLTSGNITVTAEGQIPKTADGRPLDAESAAKNLTKFGSTGFVLADRDLICEIGENLWMPASALNELRRNAAEMLREKLESAPDEVHADEENTGGTEEKHEPDIAPVYKKRNSRRTAEFLDPFVLTKLSGKEKDEIAGEFDIIYVPHEWAEQIKSVFDGTDTEIAAVMPALEPSAERVSKIIAKLASIGISRFMTHTVGQTAQVIRSGFTADISFRGNITNSAAVRVYSDMGCESIYASPELPAGAVSAMNLSAIVYGKLPAMTLSRCLIAQAESKKGCVKGNEGGRASDPDSVKPHRCRCTITDRTGSIFEVFGQQNCENIIVNTHPLWMGDRMDTLKGAGDLCWYFTSESAEEIIDILRRYRNGEKGEGRRM